jgi:hypothetical protein
VGAALPGVASSASLNSAVQENAIGEFEIAELIAEGRKESCEKSASSTARSVSAGCLTDSA